MCFDAKHRKTLLFGGYFQSPTATQAFDETWAWDGSNWQQLSPQTQPRPSGRWYHKMAYDMSRERAVMFGGFVPGAGLVNETWEWDGFTWLQRNPANSPSPRAAFCMAHDSWRQRTVLFGGFQGAGANFAALGDTWIWDGNNWTQSPAVGPTGRGVSVMAFDSKNGEMVLFGGDNGTTTTFGDTWTFDGVAWRQRVTAVAPPARRDAIMAHDVLSGETILVGGADRGLITTLADTWVWDGHNWSQFPALLVPPRWASGISLDSDRGEMVAFGGRDTVNGVGTFYGDTQVLPSSGLRTMSVVSPPLVGQTSAFAFQYPPSAAGNFSSSLLTAPTANEARLWINGFTTFGLTRVDLLNVYWQLDRFLDNSGVLPIPIAIPSDPGLVGVSFDLQTVDLAANNNTGITIFWASNDVTATIQALPPPVANFSQAVSGPLSVQFTDASTGSPTNWQWDFDNNGTVDSTAQNPSWTYAAPGIYSVRLVAANAGGSNVITKANVLFLGINATLNMVPIRPGTFAMGSSIGQPGEQPVHSVTISRPFWMGKYEVTRTQYSALMPSDPSTFGNGTHPVHRVTWTEAQDYCARLTSQESNAGRLPAGMAYRLPTEAEWEYCCRAGTTTEWNTGVALACAQACFGYYTNVCSGASSQTRAVGSYLPNAFGLHDMHGNVWEWCLDANSPYAGSFGYATPNYPSGPVSDPYVSEGTQRIVRGGDYFLSQDPTRSAFRNVRAAGFVGNGHGFRVVLAPTLP